MKVNGCECVRQIKRDFGVWGCNWSIQVRGSVSHQGCIYSKIKVSSSIVKIAFCSKTIRFTEKCYKRWITAIKWSFSFILWTFVIEQTVLVLNAFFYNRRAKFLPHFVIYTTLVADWPFDLVNWPFDLVSWPLNTIRTIRKEVKNQDIHPLYNCTTHTPEALTFTPPWFWLFPDHQQPFKLHPFI